MNNQEIAAMAKNQKLLMSILPGNTFSKITDEPEEEKIDDEEMQKDPEDYIDMSGAGGEGGANDPSRDR